MSVCMQRWKENYSIDFHQICYQINWAIIQVDAQKDFLNVENQSLFLEKNTDFLNKKLL